VRGDAAMSAPDCDRPQVGFSRNGKAARPDRDTPSSGRRRTGSASVRPRPGRHRGVPGREGGRCGVLALARRRPAHADHGLSTTAGARSAGPLSPPTTASPFTTNFVDGGPGLRARRPTRGWRSGGRRPPPAWPPPDRQSAARTSRRAG
jgi:hypothetical protein